MTDIIIALILIGIVLILFLLSRLKLLPKKSLPYIFLALAAGLGIGYFKARKGAKEREEIKRLNEEITRKKAQLKDLENEDKINSAKLEAYRKELDRKMADHTRETLKEKTDLEEEKKRLDNLTAIEVFEEYRKIYGADSI